MSASILNNTYDGSLFNNPAEAALASLTDYLLAGGSNATGDALAEWRSNQEWSAALAADSGLREWVACDPFDEEEVVEEVASLYEDAWGKVGEVLVWELIGEHDLRDVALVWVTIGELQDLYIDGDEDEGEDAITQAMCEADDRIGTRDDYSTRASSVDELVEILLGDDAWMRERVEAFLDKLNA